MQRQSNIAWVAMLVMSIATSHAAAADGAADDSAAGVRRAPARSVVSARRSLESAADLRFQRRYEQFQRSDESNCHPSRASILARAVEEAGPDGFRRPEVRARLTMLRKSLSRAERRESVKMRLIEANYQKHVERQALQLARHTPAVDVPRDPMLEQLAAERAERRRRTGSPDVQ